MDIGTTFRHTIPSNELQCLSANTRIRLLATHSLSISQSGAAQCLQVTQPPKPESHGHQLQERSICLSFPCLSMKTKSEGCNHSIVESVTFVLFGSRLFSIRRQGLRIMKYKMDSRPQIVYLFERHTCKYERKPWACSFNFSPFSHLPVKKSAISPLTMRILTNSQLFTKPQPETSP